MKKRLRLGLAATLVVFLAALAPTAFADDAKDRRVGELENRVAELEAQNRAILELLQEIRRNLPETVQAADTPATTPTTVPSGEPRGGNTVVPAVLRDADPAPVVAGLDSQNAGKGESEGVFPKKVKAGRSLLEFYGFVRLDAIFDDSRSSSIQTPTFIRPEDPGLGTDASDSSFDFHPRLTRFGMNYDGPRLGQDGPKLSGKIEIDFQNGGRESREIIRMRHGWMKLDWDRASLLAGQTWDLISPLYPTVNNDTMMWNAGNLGDRRPQVRAKVSGKNGFSFEGGIGLSGAIDAQDLDGDGVRDGDDAALPHFQARLGYAGKNWSVGLSGHVGTEETRGLIAGQNEFDSNSLSLDLKATFDKVTFQTEIWTGENLDDFRGGIGQGINTSTGQEIESEGGWVELGFKTSDVYSIYLGYSVDDPKDGDVPAGGRIDNYVWWIVNRFRFGRPFLFGIDYLNWTTEWDGLEDGTDNRFNLYMIYNF